jgi:ABC-2 type transport system permease protein
MTAFFGGAWSGVSLIEDINNGVLDRMLATSVHRGALIAARLLHATLVGTIQSSIILGLGLALGAGLPGGFGALLAVLLAAALLGAGFSAISNAVALLTRRDETMVALVQFFGMPLAFLSTTFMAMELMPAWMRWVALGNPVNWAVTMARQAMVGLAWPAVLSYTILLAAFVLITAFLATQAFQLYRRAD